MNDDQTLIALKNLTLLFAALHPNHAEWGDYKAAIAAIALAEKAQCTQTANGVHPR